MPTEYTSLPSTDGTRYMTDSGERCIKCRELWPRNRPHPANDCERAKRGKPSGRHGHAEPQDNNDDGSRAEHAGERDISSVTGSARLNELWAEYDKAADDSDYHAAQRIPAARAAIEREAVDAFIEKELPGLLLGAVPTIKTDRQAREITQEIGALHRIVRKA